MKKGQEVTFSLPHGVKGRVWRIKGSVNGKILREVSERDSGTHVKVVFEGVGRGLAIVRFGLTRGETRHAYMGAAVRGSRALGPISGGAAAARTSSAGFPSKKPTGPQPEAAARHGHHGPVLEPRLVVGAEHVPEHHVLLEQLAVGLGPARRAPRRAATGSGTRPPGSARRPGRA